MWFKLITDGMWSVKKDILWESNKLTFLLKNLSQLTMIHSHDTPKIWRRRHDASQLQDITPPIRQLNSVNQSISTGKSCGRFIKFSNIMYHWSNNRLCLTLLVCECNSSSARRAKSTNTFRLNGTLIMFNKKV